LGKLRTRLGGIGGLVMFLWRRTKASSGPFNLVAGRESGPRTKFASQINEFGKSQFVSQEGICHMTQACHMTKAFERSSRRRVEPTAIFRAYGTIVLMGRAKCDLHIFPLYTRNKIRAVHFMSLHNVIRHGLNWPSRASACREKTILTEPTPQSFRSGAVL